MLSRRTPRSAGLNVVLYGPDGVGKSTAADELARSLRGLGSPEQEVLTYHAFVPTDRVLERHGSPTTKLKTRTYAQARKPLLRNLMLAGAYAKRLGLLATQVLPRLRRGAIVIHDRYLLDVFLKGQKTHPGPISRPVRRLSGIAPFRDLVFLLRADPATVSSRTGELTQEEVRSAYGLLEQCLERVPSGYVDIDASRSAEEVHAALLRAVLDHQTGRFLAAEPPSPVGTRDRRRKDPSPTRGQIGSLRRGAASRARVVARLARSGFARALLAGLTVVPARWLPLDTRLKRYFDRSLHWIDPQAVMHVILNESSMVEAAARGGAGARGRDLAQYRGLWKNARQHPTRWLTGRFVLEGPFADAADPLEHHHSFEAMRCVIAGSDWSATSEYRTILDQIERGDLRYSKGATTRVELDRYFEGLASLARSIADRGFQTQQQLSAQPGDEIRVVIGPTGELIAFAGGTHRLAAAQQLGVPRVPVLIKAVHRDWLRSCMNTHGQPVETAIVAGLQGSSTT